MKGWGSHLIGLVAVVCSVAEATVPSRDFAADLEARSIRFFVDHGHPQTGMVRDRAPNFDQALGDNYRMASIAATGFGLAVLANAAKRGLIDPEVARAQILRTLEFIETKLWRYHGWFYHFVDWETGVRWESSEISTIDTALLITGALYAGQALQDEQIQAIAMGLYRGLNFFSMLDDTGTLSMGWTPEGGMIPHRWDRYAEHLVLILLGLGHPSQPVPVTAWTAWERDWVKVPTGEPILGAELPLFVHQYSHLFIDFQKTSFAEKFFDNSKRATDYNRAISKIDTKYETYRKGFWGLSACYSADGYRAFSPTNHDGTVCPGCAIASAMFKEDILPEIRDWTTGSFGARIWGRYGFIDGFNLDRNWYDTDSLGITVGPAYLALANRTRSTSIWADFMNIPNIRVAIARAEGASGMTERVVSRYANPKFLASRFY